MKITEVMQQLRDEAKRRHASAASAHNGTAENIESAWSPPVPPTLHVTPLIEDGAEKFGEVQRRAQEKTDVSRYVPKFLRRLFRQQGGFNKQVLEVAKFLMKENRETNKRLREIIAYLQAENGWFDGVMAAFAQVQRTLQRRIDNQYSLEARLLVMDNKVAEARSESLQRRQQLEERLGAIASALDEENNARCKKDTQLGALNDALTAETKAREAVEERVDGFAGALEAVRAALVDEAKAREAVEVGVSGQHVRLDAISNTLDAVHQALAAEAKAREGLGLRLDEDQTTNTLLSGIVNELSEAVRSVKTENDRLSHDLQATKAAFSSMQDLLSRMEERQVSDASYLKRELHIHSQTLGTLHGLAQPTRGRKGTAALPVSPGRIDQNQFDSFYLAFENQFRGTRTDIKQRVRVYVPFLKKARVGKRETPVLDLGCGRGEWLELLRDEGLVGRGIDLNEFMVSECLERKLKVTQADVIEYLGTLRSDSVGAITAFHLIEHLPFPILAKLFAESLRVLRAGGICIFETPNPDNLQVGSNRFYSDPTHLHPLPHAFTSFVMSTTGFKRVEVLPLHPDDNAVPMTDEAAPIERFAHQMFFGAQDYAVIGRK